MRCVEFREGRVLVFLVGLFAVWKTGAFCLWVRYPVCRLWFYLKVMDRCMHLK